MLWNLDANFFQGYKKHVKRWVFCFFFLNIAIKRNPHLLLDKRMVYKFNTKNFSLILWDFVKKNVKQCLDALVKETKYNKIFLKFV
jgi:hypothetical protein